MLGIEKAFIQASVETKMPFDETAFAIWCGCRILDIPTQLYTFTRDIQDELSKDTLVHGGVPHVVAALNLLGVPIPEVQDYPLSLFRFLGRHIKTSTIGYLRQRGSLVPVFVKPRGGTKLFNGFERRPFNTNIVSQAQIIIGTKIHNLFTFKDDFFTLRRVNGLEGAIAP